jgi:hypothetical protein
MRPLPVEIEQRIPGHMRVIGWWRRAKFEIVEEWSVTLWRIGLILMAARTILLIFEARPGLMFIAAIVIAIVFYAMPKAFFEHFRWLREVYVVCEDTSSDGGFVRGRVYKFIGSHIFQMKGTTERTSDAITSSWPATYDKQANWEKAWGWFTKENMVRVNLAGATETYLSGKRVSPDFLKAIERIQGAKPRKLSVEEQPRSLVLLEKILDLANGNDPLIDRADAKAFARDVLVREIYETEYM